MQAVRGVVGWPRTPLVFAVLGDKQPALQSMVVRRETNAVRVPVPPREGLDGGLRVCGVDFRSQDGTVANAHPGRTVERLHARAVRAEVRIPARRHTTTRVEYMTAQRNVLTRDVMLIGATAVVATDHAGVGRRPLRPVNPAVFEGDLLRRMVSRGQTGDEPGDVPGLRVHGHDARAVVLRPNGPNGLV